MTPDNTINGEEVRHNKGSLMMFHIYVHVIAMSQQSRPVHAYLHLAVHVLCIKFVMLHLMDMHV